MLKNKIVFIIIIALTSNLFASAKSDYKKGLKYLKKGQYSNATQQFNKILYSSSDSNYKLKAKLGLIECNTNYLDTLALLHQFLKENPNYEDKANVHYKLGHLYYLHNNLESATRQLSIITNQYKDTKVYFGALYWLGNCLMQNKEFNSAQNVFKIIINHKKYNSYQPLASLRIADIYFYQKKFYSAITNYKQTLKNYRTPSVKIESYFFLAQSYEMIKNFPQAKFYYSQTIKKDKNSLFADMSRERIQYLNKKHPNLLKKNKRKLKKTKPSTKPFYYVQVGSFENLSSANNLRLFLKKEKFPAFFKKVKLPKKYIYKIWVGPYKTYEKSSKIKSQIISAYKLEAFIIQE